MNNEPNDRGTINVKAGQEFVVALESTPGSGAIWYYDNNTGGQGINFTEENREDSDSGIGGAIRQIFHFEATQAGVRELVFELKRVWEREVRRRKVFEVQVT